MKKRKLPTEEEIINRIEADWSKPKVTFLSTTYNQQDYIADTIEGFLIQKTSFPFEIIIHDDCSTDKTRKVIDSYKAKYPNLIRTIYQKQNQYSQGVSVTLIAAKEARAEYIALCEGDDYWINENKIENQLSLMLEDPSITMVVSSGKAQYGTRISNEILGFHGNKIKQIHPQYIVDFKVGLAPTASYVVKKEFLIKSRDLFKDAPVGDFFIELYNAIYGKLVYFPEVVCVYRRMAKNSWSSRMASNLENSIKHFEAMQNTIDKLKKLEGFSELDWTNSRAQASFNLAILHLKHNDSRGFSHYITLSNNLKKLTGKKKLIYNMRTFAPILYKALPAMQFVNKQLRVVQFKRSNNIAP